MESYRPVLFHEACYNLGQDIRLELQVERSQMRMVYLQQRGLCGVQFGVALNLRVDKNVCKNKRNFARLFQLVWFVVCHCATETPQCEVGLFSHRSVVHKSWLYCEIVPLRLCVVPREIIR